MLIASALLSCPKFRAVPAELIVALADPVRSPPTVTAPLKIPVVPENGRVAPANASATFKGVIILRSLVPVVASDAVANFAIPEVVSEAAGTAPTTTPAIAAST